MSTHQVPVVQIKEVIHHPGADKLDLAFIEGWQCVCGRSEFKGDGELGLYIPIDSILPKAVEEVLFANSKIRPSNGRIRTVKIRGEVSQGLLVSLDKFPQVPRTVGFDAASLLGISKWEPPAAPWEPRPKSANKQKTRKAPNRNFHKYTDLENIKWYKAMFQPGEQVVITEKVHGTNFRAGYVPVEVDTLWKRVKKFLGFLKPFEFVYGSRNVQLHEQGNRKKVYYGKDIYFEAVNTYGIDSRLQPGEVVYGEIYGAGVQTGYDYNCKHHRELVIFDVFKDGKYLDHAEFVKFCYDRGLPMAPVLYVGPYSEEILQSCTVGESLIDSEQKVREGCVIRPLEERIEVGLGRKILKSINPEYLLRDDNTDFH